MDLQKSEDEESSYALAILDGTAKPKNTMFCTVDGEKYPSFTEHTWIGDAGSSCHITNQSTSVYDVESINEHVQDICGGMQATKKGKLCCNRKQVDGSMTEKVLSPMNCFPKSDANLFSIACELSQGATLGNDANKNITLKNGDILVVFGFLVKAKDGWVVGLEILPVPQNEAHIMADVPRVISDDEDIDSAGTNIESAVSNVDSTKRKYKDMNELHAELSHPSEATTQASGMEMNFIVIEKFQPCEDCAMCKAN